MRGRFVQVDEELGGGSFCSAGPQDGKSVTPGTNRSAAVQMVKNIGSGWRDLLLFASGAPVAIVSETRRRTLSRALRVIVGVSASRTAYSSSALLVRNSTALLPGAARAPRTPPPATSQLRTPRGTASSRPLSRSPRLAWPGGLVPCLSMLGPPAQIRFRIHRHEGPLPAWCGDSPEPSTGRRNCKPWPNGSSQMASLERKTRSCRR